MCYPYICARNSFCGSQIHGLTWVWFLSVDRGYNRLRQWWWCGNGVSGQVFLFLAHIFLLSINMDCRHITTSPPWPPPHFVTTITTNTTTAADKDNDDPRQWQRQERKQRGNDDDTVIKGRQRQQKMAQMTPDALFGSLVRGFFFPLCFFTC
jgi:hypothetical protein